MRGFGLPNSAQFLRLGPVRVVCFAQDVGAGTKAESEYRSFMFTACFAEGTDRAGPGMGIDNISARAGFSLERQA